MQRRKLRRLQALRQHRQRGAVDQFRAPWFLPSPLEPKPDVRTPSALALQQDFHHTRDRRAIESRKPVGQGIDT